MVWSWFFSRHEVVATTVKQGKIRGHKRKVSGEGVYTFRGVPFAKPPIGPLRFKRPEPHPSWEGVKDCFDFGLTSVQGVPLFFLMFLPKFLAAICYSYLWLTGQDPLKNNNPRQPHPVVKTQGEDCLTLNIETTTMDPNAKLPVMVWIHGGAFQQGAGSQLIFHPNDSTIARNGVVLVTINYRLGLIGFLKVEGGDYNCGIYDQLAALTWVQENITSFGGDPSNVTIFGESAGAMSCGVLSASPYAGKLFHRVIYQSGSIQMGITKEDAAFFASEVARCLEIPACTQENLASFSAAAILAAQNAVIRSGVCGEMPVQPVVDGEVLPEPVVACYRAGSAKDLEVMVGYTKNEELLFWKLFPKAYICESEDHLIKKIQKLFGPRLLNVKNYEEAAVKAAQEIKAWESSMVEGKDFWTNKAVLISSLLKFALPAHATARTLSVPGRCKSCYLFRFDVHSPLMGGAGHAIDLPYVFNSLYMWGKMVPPNPTENTALALAVVTAWTNFAKTGNPNLPPSASTGDPKASPHLPQWTQAVTPDSPHEDAMILDTPLRNSRMQAVDMPQAFPLLMSIVEENEKALWFHRAEQPLQPARSPKEEQEERRAHALRSQL